MEIEEVVAFLKENIKNMIFQDEESIQSGKVTNVSVNQNGAIVIRHEHGRIDLETK